MRWLFFLFSALAFAIAFRTHSVGLALLCLLAALGLMVAGVVALASHRIDARARHEGQILSPDDIRRMREQAEQRRASTAGAPNGDAGSQQRSGDSGAGS